MVFYVLLCLKVAKEIWVCEKETITKWKGDIISYKSFLKARIANEEKANKAK